MRRLAVLLVALGAIASPAPGQEPGRAAPIFERLVGAWSGSGALFDRPASFGMEWRLEWGGRIATLRFHNAFVAEGGATRPVLEAVAYYRTEAGNGGRGIWIDSRGEILTLRFEAADSSLTVHWESESERGRTEYTLSADDALEVRDFVWSADEWRAFGWARYRRGAQP